jgi:hypothetical protein
MLPVSHILYVVDALQLLQQRRCQVKRLGKTPHAAGRGEETDNICKCLPFRLIDCHSRRDSDRKSSSAEFEENGGHN